MIRRTPVTSALIELEAGRLSTEEALRAALQGRDALAALIDRAAARRARRPTVYRLKQAPSAVAWTAVARVRKMLARVRAVSSVHWGVCRVRGLRTNECAVVVHVTRKLSMRALRAGRRKCVPRHVRVQHAGRQFAIRVDVQAVSAPARLHLSFARPGDHGMIRNDGTPIGALGAIVSAASGDYAVTAGHVAALLSGAVDCVDDGGARFALGAVHHNRLTATGTDIAAIGPVPVIPAGAALDGTFVRDPSDGDVNRRVTLALPRSFTPIESHVNNVGVSRTFALDDGGEATMDGLTAITSVTQPGDSGAAVLDEQGTLIGFVVGGDGLHTYLIPARKALDELETHL